MKHKRTNITKGVKCQWRGKTEPDRIQDREGRADMSGEKKVGYVVTMQFDRKRGGVEEPVVTEIGYTQTA